jgi:hypothetical protein
MGLIFINLLPPPQAGNNYLVYVINYFIFVSAFGPTLFFDLN